MAFKPKLILNLAIRQKFLIFSSIFVCCALSMVQFKYVPKKYKIPATISIGTQYFQVPLVRDFMSETYESGELRAERESLLRRSLNFEFLRELGMRFNLFGSKKESEISTADLEELSRKFEIIPVGGNSFLISYFTSNADQGYVVVQELIKHLKSTLAEERRSMLTRLHSAVQDQLEALSFGKQTGTVSPMLAYRPDLVREEITRLREQVAVYRSTYSDRHPQVAELTRRLNRLSAWLKPNTESGIDPRTSRNFSSAKVDPASMDLFQDLLKKYHYLEVVIFLDQQSTNSYLTVLNEPFVPRSPMWPKRPVYLIWGAVVGFLLGSITAFVIEVGRNRRNGFPSV